MKIEERLSRSLMCTIDSLNKRGLPVNYDEAAGVVSVDCPGYDIAGLWVRRDWEVTSQVFTVTGVVAGHTHAVRAGEQLSVPHATFMLETDKLLTSVRILNPVSQFTSLNSFIGAKLLTFKPTVLLESIKGKQDVLIVESLRFDASNALNDEPEGFVTAQMLRCASGSPDKRKMRRMVPVWSPVEQHSFSDKAKCWPVTHSREGKSRLHLIDLHEYASCDEQE